MELYLQVGEYNYVWNSSSFEIYTINLPPTSRALGDDSDTDAQNSTDFSPSYTPLLRISSYSYQLIPGIVIHGKVSKSIVYPYLVSEQID